MPKITVEKAKEFLIRIADVGTNTCHVGYKKVTNTNALTLVYGSLRTISNDLVGKELSAGFQYHLACLMLKLINFDKEKLMDDIENAEESFNTWELSNEPKVRDIEEFFKD